MHLSAAVDLLLADDWDIVFRLARYDARVAPHAGIDVDRHSPLIVLFVSGQVLFVRVHRLRIFVVLMPHRRVIFKLLDIPYAKQIAALHIEMDLSRSDIRFLTRCLDLAKAVIHCIGAANIERIVAETRADLTGTRTAVAHIDSDDVIGLPRRDPNRDRLLDIRALIGQRHKIGKLVTALCIDKASALRPAGKLAGVVAGIQFKPRGGLRAYQRDVVPRDLVERIRQFLQPAVIHKAAVINTGIR